MGGGRGFAGVGAARKEPEEVQVRQEVDPIRSGKGPLHRVLRRHFATENPDLTNTS